jgi:3-deoxy-D-manno-octulosonic-acid transferase
MNRAIYNFGISILSTFFSLFYWVKPKWKLRYLGLKKQTIEASTSSRLWFHCASAGEFEQIASVITKLSKALPEFPVIITFFSPSGIEWMESKKVKWEYAYLPFDGVRKMKQFIKEINPKCLIVAKNELWFNLINELNKEDIPIFLVSAKVSDKFIGLKASFFKMHLKYIRTIFAQDQATVDLLKNVCTDVILSGDTRISRIYNSIQDTKETPILFKSEKSTIIYGSLHKEDVNLLSTIHNFPQYNHIVVPHDVSAKSIDFFSKILGPNPPLYSQEVQTNKNYIIIDKIGLLARLYKKSSFAYIGGGFSNGIHNIIEAISQNNSIFIGPNYHSFNEATTLVEKGVINVIQKPSDFEKLLVKEINLPFEEMDKKKRITKEFIDSHREAAQFVSDKIYKEII